VLKEISPKNDAKVFGLHVLSVHFFQVIVPCGTEWRHLLPMVPSLLALSAIGLSEALNQSKHWNGTSPAIPGEHENPMNSLVEQCWRVAIFGIQQNP
jgi:hypothetical protein